MRIASIEFFRTLAIFAVVLLHTSPFRNSENSIFEFLYIGISNSTRFAVPYFFIIAGYFFGKKIQGGTSPTSLFRLYVARLFPLFLIWTTFYMLLPTDIKKQVITLGLLEAMYLKVYGIFSDPITLLFQGSRGHLWFLISLLIALGIVTLLIKLDRKQWILPIASLLYCFGLIAGSYSTTPFGIEISFNTRNGPFFSTLFVATGWHLSLGKYKLSSKYAFGLAALGMIMHMTEVLFLWKFYHISPVGYDYFVGTLLWGTGFTMFVLSIPNAFQESQITKYGRYVLGIYLVPLLSQR